MNPAPQVALAASAANRPSIAARPRSPWARGVRPLTAVAMAFAVAVASAQGVGLSGPALSSGASNPMGSPEPTRPTLTTPYDGAIAAYRAGRVERLARTRRLGIPQRPHATAPIGGLGGGRCWPPAPILCSMLWRPRIDDNEPVVHGALRKQAS